MYKLTRWLYRTLPKAPVWHFTSLMRYSVNGGSGISFSIGPTCFFLGLGWHMKEGSEFPFYISFVLFGKDSYLDAINAFKFSVKFTCGQVPSKTLYYLDEIDRRNK